MKGQPKIGADGRAIKERHFTDHNRPWAHSNPHDHFINWNNQRGFPKPGSPINYPDEAPEFKSFKEIKNMSIENTNNDKKITYTVIHVDPEIYRFKTISDFKWAMEYNSEVAFEWNGKDYSITHPDGVISICEGNKYSEAKDYKTADEALEYVIDGQRLRDIITKVTVWDRTI